MHKLLEQHFPYVQDTSSKHSQSKKKTSHLESNFFHKRLCNDPALLIEDKTFLNSLFEKVDERQFRSVLKEH